MDQQYWYEDQKQQHFSGADHKKRSSRTVTLATLIVCMLITGLVGGAAGGLITHNAQQKQMDTLQAQVTAVQQTQTELAQNIGSAGSTATAPVASGSEAVPAMQSDSEYTYTKAQVVEYCAPSIVGIDVEVPGYGWGRQYTQTGSGSGIVFSEDGYIITNNHVVEGATNIKVYLYDDTEYPATLVGTDAKTDLAVIKIEATDLRPVTMGDSELLRVGDDVLAIGNPLGEFRGSATSGMISSLSSTLTIEGQQMTLLQTDAAINPGNSGGGLFNMRGELVGVVNAKIASNTTEGLGFAIPVDDAKQVIADLMNLGYVSGRAYLGVYMDNVTVQTGDGDNSGGSGYGIDNFFGFFGGSSGYETRVVIVDLVPGGAAERGGLKVGDYILAVDDTEVTDVNQLAIAIREYNAGDQATIKVQRDGQELDLSVVFTENVPEDKQ